MNWCSYCLLLGVSWAFVSIVANDVFWPFHIHALEIDGALLS